MAEVQLEDGPRKARELFDKGFRAMERDNLDYAMDMFMEALDIEPRLLKTRKFLRAAAVKKFKARKGGQIAHIIATITNLPMLVTGMGLVKTKPAQALKTAEKLLRKDPLNMLFINLLGQAAHAAEMPEVAIQTLEVAKEHYPKRTDVLEWLGQIYIETGNGAKARECFDEIVRIRPNDPKAVKALKDATALDTMQKGGWGQAESFRDVIKDTDQAVRFEREAKAVKSDKDLDDLIQDTMRKIQREPENAGHRRTLADLYTQKERFEDAIKSLEDALRLGGSDPQVEQAMSGVRVKQFDYQIGRLQSEGNRSGAEAKTRERDEFIFQDANDRVKRYPNDLPARYQLGEIQYQRGMINEAIQQFQLSQRHPQRRVSSLHYLGLCFRGKEQYDIAVEQLTRAVAELRTMDETKKEIVYDLAATFEAMGSSEKALEFYKQIYAVDIGYKDVAMKIEQSYRQ